MKLLSSLRTFLDFVFRRPRVEQEMDEELRSHLQTRTDDLERKGFSRAEAERQARVEFGGFERYKEECREALGSRLLGEVVADVRYGLRQLRRSPGFVAVAVATLALGIGATTAIFGIVDAVLLHGSPYRNLSQLVNIVAKGPPDEGDNISPGDFNDWQAQNQAFSDLAAYKRWEFHVLTGYGEPDEVWTFPVSTNTFHLLGVNTILGRSFAENETQVAVASYEYWRGHFAADPNIIGKPLALDGKPYTLIGVAPPGLEFPDPNVQMWIPITLGAAERNDHERRSLHVFARLKQGVTLSQAQAAMDLASRRLAMQYPKTHAGWTALVEPLTTQDISTLRLAILTLLGAVVFVLLIVCANVASMLLARGSTRQGEMATRAALGAGRLRLIRQLVVEAVLLAGLASVVGGLLAHWGLTTVLNLLPKYILVETQALHRISINLPVLGFTVALSLLTGIAVGLLPALRVSNLNLNESLKQSARTSGPGAARSRLQRALVVFQVALALVLLVGAGLMIQSFQRLEATPTGFKPDHLLSVRVPLMSFKYAQGSQAAAFYQNVLARIQAIPGVKSVGMANNLPFTGFSLAVDFPPPPNAPGGPARTAFVYVRCISPGYFQAMGIPLKKGRDFTGADNQRDAPCVRIVNEAMARRYWPGEDPVGRQVPGACAKNAPALIVGVVADSKWGTLAGQPDSEMYEPYAQHPFASFLVTFAIRTSSNPTSVAAAVRHAVWEVDHDQPVIQIRTMENVISESIWRQHMSASMLGIFAAIALLLSAVGIYGVFSYSVTQRTHEIGIRTALGASRRDILKMVVGEGLLLTLIGVGAGIIAALALTRLLASLLYGIRPRDPLTFVGLSLLLSGVALLASYIPARRATKVDPMEALRYE
jgi:putative ABC transport system permease protein